MKTKILPILLLAASVAMGAIRYVEPGNGTGFVSTQDGSSGAPFKGMYGVQKAIDGASAGDTILIKSPSDTQNIAGYVMLTGITENKSATWVVGDTVYNHVGDGNDWYGLINAVYADSIFIKQIKNAISAITILDSVYNKNRVDSVGFTGKKFTRYVNVNTLVSLTGVTENKTATWVVGDSLQNHVGDGNDWTGVLCEITATTILVETRNGFYADIATADSLTNITRTDSVTFTGKSLPGIIDDRAVGTTSAPLYIYGTNSSWAVGTNVVFWGGATPAIPTILTSSVQYRIYKNLSFIGSTASTWINTAGYLFAYHMEASGSGTCGLRHNAARCWFTECKFIDNDSVGVYTILGDLTMRNSFVYGSGIDGIYVTQRPSRIENCIVVYSGRDGINYASNGYEASVVNSVVANNTSHGIETAALLLFVENNKIFSNGGYAIRGGTETRFIIENNNSYQSNTSGDYYRFTTGMNHVTEDDAKFGVVDVSSGNYSTAVPRTTAIKLNW